MRPGIASRTAQHNALFRALEGRLPRPLFHDPWARRFLRGGYRAASLLPARAVAWAIDRRWPGPRAAVAVRTRYIDDAVEECLAEGLEQLVLLGAGLDARAHRMAGLERVRVFEVDHPATQAFKLHVLGARPAHVVYVSLDLKEGVTGRALERAGFSRERRTLFLWEGVTNYLDDASVDATLRMAAANGGDLVFTYVDRAILDGSAAFQGARQSMDYVRKLGEPFTFGFDPAAVAAYLRDRGLDLVDDQPLHLVARRYYGDERPPVSAYYRVARALCRG